MHARARAHIHKKKKKKTKYCIKHSKYLDKQDHDYKGTNLEA